MKKILILIPLILGWIAAIYGQHYDYYYYYRGIKTTIPIHNNDCLIFVDKDTTNFNDLREAGFAINNIIPFDDFDLYCVKVSSNRYSHSERDSLLLLLPGVKSIEPIIGYENDTNEILVSNRFYVKLKQLSDTIRLKEFANQYKVRVEHPISYCDLWYALSTTKESFNSIACANFFYESGAFQDIDPGFLFDFRSNCVSDLYFSVEQWGLNSENYGINACGAWGITTGVPNIRVAIVDSGLDLTH